MQSPTVSCYPAPVTAPKRRATYEDLCRVPEPLVAEILDGELFTSPRPAIRHALAASRLGMALGPFGADRTAPDAPGGWWILDEPELHLADDVLVPDLAGWRRARVPILPDVVGMTIVPDWACEVISPSTGAIDRGRKMRIYAREGVAHLWIVDPVAHTLEVYRLEDRRWVVVSTQVGSDAVRAEPFDALALEMRSWWREGDAGAEG